MEFYHGTSKEHYDAILKEGVLYGIPKIDHVIHRSTCLTPYLDEARMYGDVVLKVHYNPEEHSGKHNYKDGCRQFIVYEPIDLKDVELIQYNEDVTIKPFVYPHKFDNVKCFNCSSIFEGTAYHPFAHNTVDNTILHVVICPKCKTFNFITV